MSNSGVSDTSSAGYGIKIFDAYDPVKRNTGFGLDPGVSAEYKYIEGTYVSCTSLFINLVWK